MFEYNQLVRKMLKEDLGVPFTVGDYLVVNEAWVVDDEVVMTTGEEYEVNGVKPHTHPVYPELKGWQVMLDGFTDRPVFTMDWANDYDLYKKVLRQASDDAKKAKITWRQYYALQEYFVDLRPLYSLTAHKSQGSTFRNVFMDFPPLRFRPKSFRVTGSHHHLLPGLLNQLAAPSYDQMNQRQRCNQ